MMISCCLPVIATSPIIPIADAVSAIVPAAWLVTTADARITFGLYTSSNALIKASLTIRHSC